MRLDLAVLLTGILLGPVGIAAAQTSTPPAPGGSGPQMGKGVRATGVTEAIANLNRASASLERRDGAAAASEIRRAAIVLTTEAGRVGPPGKTALEDEAASLRRLADDVARGVVVSAERIVDAIPPPSRPRGVLHGGGDRDVGAPGDD